MYSERVAPSWWWKLLRVPWLPTTLYIEVSDRDVRFGWRAIDREYDVGPAHPPEYPDTTRGLLQLVIPAERIVAADAARRWNLYAVLRGFSGMAFRGYHYQVRGVSTRVWVKTRSQRFWLSSRHREKLAEAIQLLIPAD